MPRKKDEGQSPSAQNILQQSMEDVLHASMLPYAEYVILERALPRVEDGLKPVQRRILYTMHELGVTPDKPHRKSARIVGDCLGKFHPHGDSSVYEAMVRMAQDFMMSAPLVDGHGNFGSIDGDPAAALRYTETRMAPLATELLRDIEKDTVSFRLNFDDTLKEPDMLPGRFPNLLVNGASGIAVGLATNIPPHNLGEAIDAVIAQMQQPDIPLDALMRMLPGPDFPTGGLLYVTDELKKAYETGRGKLTVRAKVSIENGAAGRKLLVITEIPYQINKSAMLENILKLSEEKKGPLGAIYDIRDESDRAGMRAVIELRKDADAQKVLQYLYKYSDLQGTFGVNMMAIAEGKPMQLGLKDVMAHYIRHQKQVVTRRTQYDLQQAKAREHVLQGLMIALVNLDEVIALIRASNTPAQARDGLCKAFELTQTQAQAILDLRLQRLTGLEMLALRKEHEDMLRLIARYEGILASEKKLEKLIISEMQEIRKQYARPRRTRLVQGEPDMPEYVEETVAEDAVLVLSQSGTLKRMPPKTWERAEQGEAQGQAILVPGDCKALFFTNTGNAHILTAAQVPECKPKDRGMAVNGLLTMEEGEQVVAFMPLRMGAIPEEDALIFYTRGGMIKVTQTREYQVRKSRFQAIGLKGDDRLLRVEPLQAGENVFMVSRMGMVLHVLDAFSVQGRTASGVKGMALDVGDALLYAGQLQPVGEWLLISERGFAKRALAADFTPQKRATKGVSAFAFLKSGANGTYLAAALPVTNAFAFEMAQKSGALTTLRTDEVPLQTRTGKGQQVLFVAGEDTIVQVNRL